GARPEGRMTEFLSREQVRALDRRAIEEFGVPGVVLMENAGRGAAEVLLRLGVAGRVVVCCGKGNNGGVGLVTARDLDNRGAAVRLGPCVRAHHTVKFVAEKKGFTNPAARAWTGEVHVVDIGAPRALVQALVSGTPAG